MCRLGLECDFLKVLDFGLVQHDTRSATGRTFVSEPELAAAGTPAYMPPELVSGEPIDGRLDLYALGCVGYYLHTGATVFEADTPLRMIGQHLRAPPVPPSVRSGRVMPSKLEELILACLAKDPSHRPGSAGALDRELAAIDCPPWCPEQAQAWWEANLGSSVPPSPVVFSDPGTAPSSPTRPCDGEPTVTRTSPTGR